jgi:hypothetical protein
MHVRCAVGPAGWDDSSTGSVCPVLRHRQTVDTRFVLFRTHIYHVFAVSHNEQEESQRNFLSEHDCGWCVCALAARALQHRCLGCTAICLRFISVRGSDAKAIACLVER